MTARPPIEIYFDFDNTLTAFDVLDEIIQRFSLDEEWRVAEEEWAAGKIGSKECLERQMARVRLTEGDLRDYVAGVALDPAFPSIRELLRAHGIEPVIVSDSFSSIIRAILERNGVPGVTVLANEMRIEGDVPRIAFPHFNVICSTSANCKCSHLIRRGRLSGTRKIYVGDGQSDICPAGRCEILFAKGRLLRHYGGTHPHCVPFDDLATVHAALKSLLA